MAKVILGVAAAASLRRQIAYIRDRNPVAAERLRFDVRQSLRLLTDFPDAGKSVEGARSRYVLTRRYRYRIVYLHESDEVEVLDVLHPRQSFP